MPGRPVNVSGDRAVSRVSVYDEIDFPSYAYPQTHPTRLATIAHLAGLDPAPVDRCRVLELGCGAGGNLLPMAELLPGSEFVGMDLSSQQIGLANEAARQVGLSNLRFEAHDILDLTARSLGPFDYVIAHGLFSWTTEAVRAKLLELVRQILTPHGVAYVNYNTYPGWHVQGMLRDMLYFEAEKHVEPSARVRAARKMIDFLQQALPPGNTPQGAHVRGELQTIASHSDAFLFHAYLNVVNRPFYWHEFRRLAAQSGLQLFADAEPELSWPRYAAPALIDHFRRVSDDASQWPQLFDYTRGTASRRGLLCQVEAAVHPEPLLDRLESLHVFARLQRLEAGQGAVTFRAAHGKQLRTTQPVLVSTLTTLSEAWPNSVPYRTLETESQRHVTATASESTSAEVWRRELMHCYCNGILDMSRRPFVGATQLEANPLTTKVARFQAAEMGFATNLRHESVRPSDFDRRCLVLLDGSRSIDALVAEMRSDVRPSLQRLLAESFLVARGKAGVPPV